MNPLLRWLDRWLQSAAPPERLAALRILIGGYVLWYLGVRISMLQTVAAGEPRHFDPVGVAAFLDGPLSVGTFQALLAATLAANVAFIAGVAHRVTGPVFGGLLLFLLCYRNSWSMIYHSDNVMVFHVLILGLAPSANTWSWDAWRRSGPSASLETRQGWSFGWPIQLMCLVATLTYFLAGVAKVAGPLGWSWASGDALWSQIVVDALRKDVLGGDPPDLAFMVRDHMWLFTALAAGSLFLELIAPATLVWRPAARMWAVAALGMHWGIYFLMGILFRYQLSGMMFLPFFPAERLVTAPFRIAKEVKRVCFRKTPAFERGTGVRT